MVLRKGETLETALRSYGANPEQIAAITDGSVGPDQGRGPGGGPAAANPDRARTAAWAIPGRSCACIAFGERGIEGIAATTTAASSFRSRLSTTNGTPGAEVAEEEDEDDRRGGVRLYESLYETALKNDLPRQTVKELVRIFGYDVDFQRRVTPGRYLRGLLRLRRRKRRAGNPLRRPDRGRRTAPGLPLPG